MGFWYASKHTGQDMASCNFSTICKVSALWMFVPKNKYDYLLFGACKCAAPAVPLPTVFGGLQQSFPTENQSTLGSGIKFTPTTVASCSGYINSMLSSALLSGVVEGFMIQRKFQVKDVGKPS
jgi:hypothetical protein